VAGLVRQIAGTSRLPEIVVYAEPEAAALEATVRLALSESPMENARTLLALAAAVRQPRA
jgi:hypothetical protein